MKIFNIGLPRTGTTSFHEYLRICGVDSQHTNQGEIERWYPGEYEAFLRGEGGTAIEAFVEAHDAFSDLPWYSLYEVLDQRFGNNAVFVATYRDPDTWPRSFRRIQSFLRKWPVYHQRVFGTRFLKDDVTDEELRRYYVDHYERLSARFGTRLTLLPLEDIPLIKRTVAELTGIILPSDVQYPRC